MAEFCYSECFSVLLVTYRSMATTSDIPAQPASPSPSGGGIRKLSVIMFTDIKDFSKKMQVNEAATIEMLSLHNEIMRTCTDEANGKVIKTIGDAFLVSFESVVDAVQCAVRAQQEFLEYNKGKSENDRISVRIGIHLGDVYLRENDIFGDGVNIASRIQSLAEPGGVNISGSVYEQVKNKMPLTVVPLGVPQLKNIAEPVRVYQIIITPSGREPGKIMRRVLVARTRLKRKRTQRILILVGLLAAISVVCARYWLGGSRGFDSIAVLPFESIGPMKMNIWRTACLTR